MKIIATVSDGHNKTYLAQVTLDEIATITRGVPYAESQDRVEVGTVVRLGDHWRRVRAIDDAQARLDQQAQSLRAVADLLGTINVVVPPQPPSKSNDDCK